MKTTFAAMALAALGGLGLMASPVVAQDTAAPAAEQAKIEVKDMRIGNPDAKVTLIEYASYTCPHCASFHAGTFKELKKDYIDTGKINFVYREVYFDRYGLWASMMARCAGDMKYFGIQDILYTTQSEWATGQDPAVVVDQLKKIGLTAGTPAAQLDACMQDGAMAQALIDHYEANMEEFDVRGTPTLVLNGDVHSNMAYADLKALIDTELAK